MAETFASLLRKYRLLTGLTQEELGAQAGLSARTISDLERGIHKAPFRYTVDAITRVLALTPEQSGAIHASFTRARGSRAGTNRAAW
jgi:transcriptional regulator with XRE-family HTH domain